MTYYKITYESNTIDGLKALQGSFLGQGASKTDSSTIETTVSPPPLHQDGENVNASSGEVQAPPVSENSEATSDKNEFYPPPSLTGDSAKMDMDLEGDIPPPPMGELKNQEDNEDPGEGSVPP